MIEPTTHKSLPLISNIYLDWIENLLTKHLLFTSNSFLFASNSCSTNFLYRKSSDNMVVKQHVLLMLCQRRCKCVWEKNFLFKGSILYEYIGKFTFKWKINYWYVKYKKESNCQMKIWMLKTI